MTVVLLATDAYGGHGGIALFNRELAAALARQSTVVVIPRIVPHPPEPTPAGIIFATSLESTLPARHRRMGRMPVGANITHPAP